MFNALLLRLLGILQLLDGMSLVGIDADVGGDGETLFDDFAGVEFGIFAGPPGCTGSGSDVPTTIEDMQRMLEGQSRLQDCGDIPIILGVPVSLATLNALWTLGVMGVSAVLLKRGIDMGKAEHPAQEAVS